MAGTKIHLFPSHDPLCGEIQQLYFKLFHPRGVYRPCYRLGFFAIALASCCLARQAKGEDTARRWSQAGVNVPHCRTRICPRNVTANHKSPFLLETESKGLRHQPPIIFNTAFRNIFSIPGVW